MGAISGFRQRSAGRLKGDAHSFDRAVCAVPLVCVLPVHKVALEGLDYGIGVPLGPVGVLKQVFYT